MCVVSAVDGGRRYQGWFRGEERLQFEVNGQDYFLNFVEDERRWFVLVPTETGVSRIPVYVDVQDYERIGSRAMIGRTG